MSTETLHRGARGGGIVAAAQLAKVLIQMLAVVILSRLLEPADFGLIAMVTVFTALSELLRDFGLPTAALQADKLSRDQASNLFWVSSSLGALLGLALALSTPLIVLLYGEVELATIVPVMAIALLLNGVQAQIQVHLARAFKFRVLAATDIFAQVTGLVVAVAIARAGGGYWALVWQTLSAAGALLILRFALARWVPGGPRRHSGTRPLIRDATHLGLSQTLTFAASNADTVAIGAQYSPAGLGFYNRAFQLLTVPVTRTLAPLTQVAVPTITRGRLEGHDHVAVLLRVQSTLGIALVGVFAIAAGAAPAAIPLLLGPGWETSVILFQILAIGGCFQVFSYASYWGFLLARLPHELLRYNLITKPLTIGLVIVGSFIDIWAVALAYSISLAIAWPINLAWLSWKAAQPALPFLGNGLRCIIAGAFAAFGGGVVVVLIANPLLATGAAVASSTVIYVAVLAVSRSGRAEMRQFGRTVRSLFKPASPSEPPTNE